MRKPMVVVLVALVAAIGLASIAAASADATKQRVAITMTFHESTFALAPLTAGALKRDSGRMTESSTRGGWELVGKRGTLLIRTTAEWRDPGSPGSCGVAFGTWKVLSGTGEYARVTGGGKSAYDAHCSKWYARHEGFLISR